MSNQPHDPVVEDETKLIRSREHSESVQFGEDTGETVRTGMKWNFQEEGDIWFPADSAVEAEIAQMIDNMLDDAHRVMDENVALIKQRLREVAEQ